MVLELVAAIVLVAVIVPLRAVPAVVPPRVVVYRTCWK